MIKPTLIPLGSDALLVRYADVLSEPANRASIAFARALAEEPPPGVAEVVPGLVSVLLRLAEGADRRALTRELQLRLSAHLPDLPGASHTLDVVLNGEDLPEVADALGLTTAAFAARHNERPLRVLATGFAPGFVYCGFHGDDLVVPRREAVRPMVPAGTVLFAAGQTAIAATPIRTGWHIIGSTAFRNFDPDRTPPTQLSAGDIVQFRSAP